MALASEVERNVYPSSFSPEGMPPLINEFRALGEYINITRYPVYWGWGVPRGNRSPVLTIPGFTSNDGTLFFLNRFLDRIGYRVEPSGILYHRDPEREMARLSREVKEIHERTGQRVHIVGHSMGGAVGRGISHLNPDDVASLTALGSPNGKGEDFEKAIAPTVLAWAKITVPTFRNRDELVRKTEHLSQPLQERILTTYIYTKDDAVVNYRFTQDYSERAENIEVPGTHSALPANPHVYSHVALLLREAEEKEKAVSNIINFPAPKHHLEPAA